MSQGFSLPTSDISDSLLQLISASSITLGSSYQYNPDGTLSFQLIKAYVKLLTASPSKSQLLDHIFQGCSLISGEVCTHINISPRHPGHLIFFLSLSNLLHTLLLPLI
jgi:hypothetical protein